MLEKFGLPPKPSVRGNNWVVDASHCQGCSSQFTFINRKHHCRRCGGLFCGSCTKDRMVLRGQGDSPVRICEPCKKLEEATRFEMRYGQKNRAGKGGSKLTSKDEDDVLHQILGGEHKQSLSSKSTSSGDMHVSAQQATRSASSSSSREVSSHDMLPDSLDILTDVGNVTPEELRQQALDEKKKHRTLKLEGKPEEALKAFKRGKELETRAKALEAELRKIRKKASSSSHIAEPSGVNDGSSSKSKDKDDIASELKDLGWSDLDLQDSAKKPTKLSVESELHALLGEVSEKPLTGRKAGGPDQSRVIAHKKKALELKREGKLAEAKEELKKAKVLEKQIEEQELLGDDEESDEELSLLIRSMDEDKDDMLEVGYNVSQNFDIDPLVGFPDDIGLDNLDVTEDDMEDPEMAAEMLSLGWNEETTFAEDTSPKSAINTEALLSEIQSLKKKAVSHKRAGNTGEALALFKKAKMLEKDLHTSDFQEPNLMTDAPVMVHEEPVNVKNELNLKSAPKSISVIRKELLNLKKSARALRMEGKSHESDEMLKKGKILEQQLQEMESASQITQMDLSDKLFDSALIPDVADEGEVDDQDLNDPTYLSMLKNLGWEEDHNDHILHISKEENNAATSSIDSSVTQAFSNPPNVSRKSKSEIQRELLGLKRKYRTLRQQGQDEEAEEVLKMTKVLETQLADFETPPNKDIAKEENNATTSSIDSSVTQASNNNPPNVSKKTKSEIQRELLGLKRKSRTLRQQGQYEEAEEVLKMTMVLETQLADFETPQVKDIADEPSAWDPVKDLGTTFLLPTHPPEGKVSDIETPNLKNKSTEVHPPQNEASSLEKDITAHKRRALALKREGRIAEAKEELRQAKLLEKQMQENNSQTSTSTSNLSGFDVSFVGRNESSPNAAKKSLSPGDGKDSSPDPGKKPLSSRDRSKLQQQSLNHKRQALKLRREGRTEEADAEYELAKALEAQLEESDMHDPKKSTAEPVDNDMVEDFLDPQLLSALKAIGMGNTSSRSQGPETSEAKSISKMDNSREEEKTQLQEQIKAERLKALNFKKAGKVAEALDALRQAKGLEKKLNSLTA